MKCLIHYFFMLLFSCAFVQAQTHILDSLQQELEKLPGDSIAVSLFTDLANEYYTYDTVKSNFFLQRADTLARKLKWDYRLGKFYLVKGMLLQLSSNHEKAHLCLDTAITYFNKCLADSRPVEEKKDAQLYIATCLGQKADILIKYGKGQDAIPVFLAALKAWQASEDPRKTQAIGTYYGKISTIYYELKQFDKALIYDQYSLSSYQTSGNNEAIAWAYVYICDDFIALNRLDSAIFYLENAKPIVTQLNSHRLNVQYYGKFGMMSCKKKNFVAAIEYYKKVMAEAAATNDAFQKIVSLKMIGFCNVKLNKFEEGRPYLLKALPGAIAGNYVKECIEILENMVVVEEHSKNIPAALAYMKQLTTLKDSVNLDQSKKAIAEIENKYQAAEKAKEIIQLQSEKQVQSLSIRQKTNLNYFLSALIVIIFLAAFLLYRYIHQSRVLVQQQATLQQQQIRELEKDSELVAVNSMLKGEEGERSRLAKDLHDGLGGLLSGVKFSLINMKDNLVTTHDNMVVFERSLDMLDTSIKELRRVAHNMMPEMLAKFGLDEALKEYCLSVNATKLLAVKYQSYGEIATIEPATAIIIYRIVQELQNNILKHAGATETLVQLIREEGRLNLLIEDNGIGFDAALLENNKGAGWANIRSRVLYLKGQLDIHTAPGKGTMVNIEFNI